MVSRSFVMVLAALALAAAGAGCSNTTPRTEVIVVVDSDLRGPTGINNIIATVLGPEGDIQMSNAQLGPDDAPLPRTLGLVWDGGDLGPFTVRLTGNRGGLTLAERAARFYFQEGRTLVLRMDLLASCEGITCPTMQTCGETGCRSIDVAASELTEWTGTVPGLDIDAGVPMGDDAGPPVDGGPPTGDDGGPPTGDDAGPPTGDDGGPPTGDDAGPVITDAGPPVDSCVPATETCNGMDDDCDGMVDEGFDLDTDINNCGTCGTRCRGMTGMCCPGDPISTCRMSCG
jgi:hypothetical protein